MAADVCKDCGREQRAVTIDELEAILNGVSLKDFCGAKGSDQCLRLTVARLREQLFNANERVEEFKRLVEQRDERIAAQAEGLDREVAIFGLTRERDAALANAAEARGDAADAQDWAQKCEMARDAARAQLAEAQKAMMDLQERDQRALNMACDQRDAARAERNAAEVALSLVSGALVDTGTIPVGPAVEFGDGVRALTRERDLARAALAEAHATLAEVNAEQVKLDQEYDAALAEKDAALRASADNLRDWVLAPHGTTRICQVEMDLRRALSEHPPAPKEGK